MRFKNAKILLIKRYSGYEETGGVEEFEIDPVTELKPGDKKPKYTSTGDDVKIGSEKMSSKKSDKGFATADKGNKSGKKPAKPVKTPVVDTSSDEEESKRTKKKKPVKTPVVDTSSDEEEKPVTKKKFSKKSGEKRKDDNEDERRMLTKKVKKDED